MKQDKDSKAIEIFRENNGILRMSEALKQGIPKHIIYSLLSKGEIVKVDRGLYSLANTPPLSYPDIVKIALLAPKAVICLISALYFYELTTQIPVAVNIALPINIRLPRINYPPIAVVRLSNNVYSTGIDEHILDGVMVKIYSPEKTITDCFKFRKKIGTDVAIEALKDYTKKYRPKVDQLIEYAKVNRVEKIMRPYLETLI